MNLFFEWDEEKRKINLTKHGVDFIDVANFWDSQRLVARDVRKSYHEERYIAYGKLCDRVMVLIYTERNNAIRIISFRKANSREAKKYDTFFKKGH